MAANDGRTMQEKLEVVMPEGVEQTRESVMAAFKSPDFAWTHFESRADGDPPNYLGTLEWGARGIGFGEFTISRGVEGGRSLLIDREGMSNDFIVAAFKHLIENAGELYAPAEED